MRSARGYTISRRALKYLAAQEPRCLLLMGCGTAGRRSASDKSFAALAVSIVPGRPPSAGVGTRPILLGAGQHPRVG
jgi:hypothetical protein